MKVLKMRYAINRPLTGEEPLVSLTEGCYFSFLEYVTDKNGRQGAKFLAHGSSGYDFHYDEEEFTLFPGDTYKGIWSYEECEGPTDWEEVSFCYTVQLVEVEE